ncbi:MAG: acetolactate synthase large subunit, partial [Lentisphaerae bacterium]|nr:acetolactate synthase large subunit [Lentisphaerota bacterium]
MRTGADAVIEGLQNEGVEIMFGVPGGTVLDLFAKLYHAPIKFVLARHEQGATHMADGYSRATGKVGCCIVTSGPGATNTVTGLATACMDGVPLVCISGQVPSSMIGNDAFQEADTVGITRAATKHNYLVKSADDLPRIIAEAFEIASTGKPGPVLIDIPKDVQRAETGAKTPDTVTMRGYKPPSGAG